LASVAAVDTVRIVSDDLTVACHPRRSDRHQVTYDPVHYLGSLAGTEKIAR
jgi:hypothetical protein